MKKIILILGIALIGTLLTQKSFAQAVVESESKVKIEFEKMIHDYGTIEKNDDGTCEFTFKNTGTQPLIITKAKGSCGCTVPNWPKEPIVPGKSGKIKVKYDTNRVGPINKSVTVTTNAGVKVLRIKGVVKAKPEVGAPVNQSGPSVK